MTRVENEMGQHRIEVESAPKWRVWLIGGTALVLVFVFGLISFDALKPTTTTGSAAAVPAAVAPVPTQPVLVSPPTLGVPQQNNGAINDGKYEVGSNDIDVRPGKYYTTGQKTGYAYATIYGPDGQPVRVFMVDGPNTITLKKGQGFETHGGLVWYLQGMKS